MNFPQFIKSICGLESKIEITLSNQNRIEGRLCMADRDRIELQTQLGTVRSFAAHEIVDLRLLEDSRACDDASVREKQKWLQKQANACAQDAFGFKAFFRPMLEEALDMLEGCEGDDVRELVSILRLPEHIRDRWLREEAVMRGEAALSWLKDDPELQRGVQFLMWYGTGNADRAMAVLTDELRPGAAQQAEGLYLQLGAANQLLGRADAMTRFWLAKHFAQHPQQALGDNDLHCHPHWLAYLDLCSDMMYFEGVREILDTLQLESDEGEACAYASLCRIFGRGGRYGLSCEAAAALCKDGSYLARGVQELVIYLRSDLDGHCRLAQEAAERILADSAQDGIRHYAPGEKRSGYLYDYTATRHDGRILGEDLMTYFMPTSVISEARRKELKRGFSQGQGPRGLMSPLLFEVEPSFKRGLSYAVAGLF